MENKKLVTIAEKGVISIKETPCGKIYLHYDNASIFYKKETFLNFLIEMDNWLIKNEGNENCRLIVRVSRFTLCIKDEDIQDFLDVIQEASYKVIPSLKLSKEIISGEMISGHMLN